MSFSMGSLRKLLFWKRRLEDGFSAESQDNDIKNVLDEWDKEYKEQLWLKHVPHFLLALLRDDIVNDTTSVPEFLRKLLFGDKRGTNVPSDIDKNPHDVAREFLRLMLLAGFDANGRSLIRFHGLRRLRKHLGDDWGYKSYAVARMGKDLKKEIREKPLSYSIISIREAIDAWVQDNSKVFGKSSDAERLKRKVRRTLLDLSSDVLGQHAYNLARYHMLERLWDSREWPPKKECRYIITASGAKTRLTMTTLDLNTNTKLASGTAQLVSFMPEHDSLFEWGFEPLGRYWRLFPRVVPFLSLNDESCNRNTQAGLMLRNDGGAREWLVYEEKKDACRYAIVNAAKDAYLSPSQGLVLISSSGFSDEKDVFCWDISRVG